MCGLFVISYQFIVTWYQKIIHRHRVGTRKTFIAFPYYRIFVRSCRLYGGNSFFGIIGSFQYSLIRRRGKKEKETETEEGRWVQRGVGINLKNVHVLTSHSRCWSSSERGYSRMFRTWDVGMISLPRSLSQFIYLCVYNPRYWYARSSHAFFFSTSNYSLFKLFISF